MHTCVRCKVKSDTPYPHREERWATTDVGSLCPACYAGFTNLRAELHRAEVHEFRRYMGHPIRCKCRVGEVWKYGTGLAYIVSVAHLDVAPQCEALIADRKGKVTSRWPDGQVRPIGIMESELIERVGTWVPAVAI